LSSTPGRKTRMDKSSRSDPGPSPSPSLYPLGLAAQVRVMEQRLGEVDWSPSERSARAEELQREAAEKERVIRSLEGEVESQRQQRLSDAKQVEAKAARIKDWVTNKLKELEEQNAHLREQNIYCNHQMELLRVRLAQLQELGQTTASRRESVAEDSSLGSFEGDASRESLDGVGVESDPRVGRGGRSRAPRHQRPLTSLEPGRVGSQARDLYAVVDPRMKKRRPSSPGPGSRGARTRSVDPASLTSAALEMRSSKARKERDSRVDSGSVDLGTPLELSPKSPLEALDEALDAVMPSLGQGGQVDRDAGPQTSGIPGDRCEYNPLARGKGPAMSHELHDYAEIYTPSREEPASWIGPQERMSASSSAHTTRTASGDSELSSSAGHSMGQAPPPPIHKYPSWEDRIYQVASDGLKAKDIVLGAQIDLSNNNMENCGPGYGTDINVPVYATVKGRASQIRSMPFTGDSSDSSDGEEYLEGSGSTPRPDTSYESEVSNDYAIPPDASTDSLVPPSMHSSSNTMESPRRGGVEKALEKSGYLTKLGGKIKSWHKRYFVLKCGVLSYWKSQHDLHRKPQGTIALHESCRVSRAEGSNTFEIATNGKNYYLTADSQPIVEEWVRVLQNVVQRNALRLLLSRQDQKPTLQGWLVKVKHGHSRRVWCVLLGKMFVYFRNPNEQNPVGQLNMRDSRVEEVEHISDSDSDSAVSSAIEGSGSSAQPTLGIFPNHVHQGPTYLIFPNRAEQEQWLYHLTVVSGGDPKAGTAWEQLVQRLMEADGEPNSPLWRHPLMVHTKEAITQPLTTFTEESLQTEAVKLFKSIQLFMSIALDSAGIDYHVVLAQNALQLCLDVPELQVELFSALIKQTSRHSAARHGVQSFLANATNLFSCESSVGSKTSPCSPPSQSGKVEAASKANPPAAEFLRGWMLLAMAVSICVPKNSKLLWFLRAHFNRNKDSKTETGKYASYCSMALERCVTMGGRIAKPSRMEVLSILLKNPHHHSLPHAVPVHMVNDTYNVVGFDGSTTVAELLATLCGDLGVRGLAQSGFTLFSDDPIEPGLEHCLPQQDKVCDVISRWETALRERGSGKFDPKRCVRFTYRNRMSWRRNCPGETEKERLLLCYQISNQIVAGRFPLNKELAFELAALMAQIDMGDLGSERGRSSSMGNPNLSEALSRFYPVRYLTQAGTDGRCELENCLAEKWRGLAGKTTTDCVRILLTCTRKWQFFGATLFEAAAKTDGSELWLAINEEGVSLLSHMSMQVIERFPYQSIVTFGGCQEDFMLVVSSPTSSGGLPATERLLFSTSKPRILEMTLLIADYMNMIGANLPKTSTRSTIHSRSVSRSRLQAAGLTSASTPNTPRLAGREASTSSLARSGSTSSGMRRTGGLRSADL